MKKTRILLTLLPLLILGKAMAQTSCTPAAPCVQLTITNTNSLPSSAVLLSCIGTSTSCTQTALTSYLSTQSLTTLCPTTTSVWKCVSFSQTKTPQNYNDPEAWNSLMNYSVQGTTAGGVSATSPILTFQVPPTPPQSPSIGSVPIMVTTGSSGPQ